MNDQVDAVTEAMTGASPAPSPEPPEGEPLSMTERVALGLDAIAPTSALMPGIKCGACGRGRTLADDYDYTPLQIATGRPLGWLNGDNEQMCGECLTKLMKGEIS